MFDHGQGITHDPLTGITTIGEDVARTPEQARAAGEMARGADHQGWRGTKVEVTLDTGKKKMISAGKAADYMAKRLRRAYDLLDCLK